jgi:hypothetical protein
LGTPTEGADSVPIFGVSQGKGESHCDESVGHDPGVFRVKVLKVIVLVEQVINIEIEHAASAGKTIC